MRAGRQGGRDTRGAAAAPAPRQARPRPREAGGVTEQGGSAASRRSLPGRFSPCAGLRSARLHGAARHGPVRRGSARSGASRLGSAERGTCGGAEHPPPLPAAPRQSAPRSLRAPPRTAAPGAPPGKGGG